VATAILVSAAAAGGGALLAVRLPPAEAMRPPAPARYRRGLLERAGVALLAGPAGMMVLREVVRRPLRTAFSSIGIAGAVALIILARFATDSLDSYVEGTLRREQRHDLMGSFLRPAAPRVVGELARTPGLLAAEGLRTIPVRVRQGHLTRTSVLVGLPPDATLRRLVGRGGREVPLPDDGVLLTRTLGEVLGLRVGDRAEIEVWEGARRTVWPVVAGLVDEAMGMRLYGRSDLLAKLERDQGAVSAVVMTVDPRRREAVEERLRRSPWVIDVSDLRADIDRLRAMKGAIIDVWTVVSIALATAVIFGVVYNNARIALAMRSRDLASLRVLGLSRREVSSILIGGLTIEVLLAIPVGLLLGRVWGGWFMASIDQETFRWAVVVTPRTYLLAAMVALLAAAASALWVRRSVDRLDLMGVLKTRE
jgi:putative ABC transport system permease protein